MKLLDEEVNNLASAIGDDPRLAASQRQRMLKIGRKDTETEFLGFDAEVRPVLRARLGKAKAASEFALFQSGQPTSVVLPMLEEWGDE